MQQETQVNQALDLGTPEGRTIYFDNTPALVATFQHPLRYLGYLGNQFKGWGLPSYLLVMFTFAWNLESYLQNPTVPLLINALGMVIGVLCISAINNHKSVNGWLGIISAGFIIASGVMSKDWGAVFQQIAYILALDIPVLLSKAWMGDKPVSKGFDIKSLVYAIVAFIVGFLAIYLLVTYALHTPRMIQNASLFGVSLAASVLCLMKYRWQYILWASTSLFAIWTWGTSFLQGDTSVIMLVGTLIYFANDIIAFTVSSWYEQYPFNINYYRNKKKLTK